MTAIVVPDIDRSTIDELKKRIRDLSEIELNLPSRRELNRAAKDVGRTADETVNRLLGRKRAPVWPWIAAGVGMVAIAGIVAAWFAWLRRPTWQTRPEPWSGGDEAERSTSATPMGSADDDPRSGLPGAAGATGIITSEAKIDPIGSAPHPIEEA